MATKSSISINYTTTTGKKGQKAITDVNPNASNDVLKTFAQSCNALTTNTYNGTSRVDKTPLPNSANLPAPIIYSVMIGEGTYTLEPTEDGLFDPFENPEDAYNPPEELILPTTVKLSEIGYGFDVSWEVDFNTDATPYVKSVPAGATMELSLGKDAYYMTDGARQVQAHIAIGANDPACLGDFVIGWHATEKFAAAEMTLTVTADDISTSGEANKIVRLDADKILHANIDGSASIIGGVAVNVKSINDGDTLVYHEATNTFLPEAKNSVAGEGKYLVLKKGETILYEYNGASNVELDISPLTETVGEAEKLKYARNISIEGKAQAVTFDG